MTTNAEKTKAETLLGWLAHLFPNKTVGTVIAALATLLGVNIAPEPFPGLELLCPVTEVSAPAPAIEPNQCEAPTSADLADIVQSADNIAYYCRSKLAD